LSEITGEEPQACATALRATLLAGSRTRDPETGRPLFAFRLHQFLSKGGTVFTTLGPEASRAIISEFQIVLPGEVEQRLFPLAATPGAIARSAVSWCWPPASPPPSGGSVSLAHGG
jgi:hypothetical protein